MNQSISRVRIPVRGFCRQDYGGGLFKFHAIAPIENELSMGFYKAHKIRKNDQDSVDKLNDYKALDIDRIITDNVRFLGKEAYTDQLVLGIGEDENYALTATPVTVISKDLKLIHPDTKKLISPEELSPAEYHLVKEIEIDGSIVDGQHRTYAFGEFILKAKEDVSEGILPSMPIREFSLSICSGLDPVKHKELIVSLAQKHNTSKSVTGATIEYKKGHLDPVREALNGEAHHVAWTQNEESKVYKPENLIQWMSIFLNEDCHDNITKSGSDLMNFHKEVDRYKAMLPHLSLLMKMYEVIQFESAGEFLTTENSPFSPVQIMFDINTVTKDNSYTKRRLTATLGERNGHRLARGFALLILHSYRHLFSWQMDPDTGHPIRITPNHSEAEILNFVKFSLKPILTKIAKRKKEHITMRQYIRASRTGDNVQKQAIKHLGAYNTTKACKEAYAAWHNKG